MMSIRYPFLLLFFLVISFVGMAQYPAPKIEIGPDRISMNEQLRITVTIYGPSNYTIDEFPEIGGFEKGNLSTSHSETKIDDKLIPTHILVKRYKPIEGGMFIIPAFEIEINHKSVRVESKAIIVEDDEEGYADIAFTVEEADFVVECSKREIYVGEGVKVRLSFYMSEKNTANWQFTDDKDLSSQVEALAKRLKPENSLESRNLISSIAQREEYIKGVRYFVYDIFEAVYYPLNAQNIDIPVLNLKMRKGASQLSVLKSKAQIIRVKELPPHPLRDKVPVGILRMKETRQGGTDKITGESFDYSITIEGQANMDVVNFGKIESDKNLDFFESGTRINQDVGKLAGTKTFSFKILPKVAGDYDLGKYFSMVFFDLKTGKYDTLRADAKFKATGETIASKNNSVQDVYGGIDNLRTDKNDFSIRKFLKVFANFVLVFMVMFLIFIWKKK
jgi:hypothetical protein